MEEPGNEVIKTNLVHIKDRIRSACIRAGRPESSVRLLLATKHVDPEYIKTAFSLGERLIGENKVQELVSKSAALAGLDLEKHFIGYLQTNKIKDVIHHVTCIQSVDRWELAEALHKRLKAEGISMDIFIEVNTSGEPGKHGVSPDDVPAFTKKIQELDTLQIKGLMTIGLFDEDPEKVRPCFTLLRCIKERLHNEIPALVMHELSMGMSGDLEIAIEEGATIIRVGTAVFGPRN